MMKLIDVFELAWKGKGDVQLHWNAEVNLPTAGYHTIVKISDKAVVAQLSVRRGEGDNHHDNKTGKACY